MVNDECMSDVVDLLIVGGGINGTGIAADASGRGLSVLLCERGDLASATSSASSKLIHGGLRYLEHWHFRLVHEALVEREILLRKAPHLIRPQRFILPHRPHLRPRWLIRCGLFLYDHLARRGQLPASKGLPLSANANNPLNNNIQYGFQYFDCKVDDARLVVANALQARQQGASIFTRTSCRSAVRRNGLWHVELEDSNTGSCRQYLAKVLVNATGPWAQSFIEVQLEQQSPQHIRLVKGSHFIVKRLYSGDQAYLLQNDDERVVFVIPFGDDFTLVGTTDTEYSGDPAVAAMDGKEEAYLLQALNECFSTQLDSADILWRYAGVRPLCDDDSAKPSAISRDYILELGLGADAKAPLLSVFGGKITTYRKLAEMALKRVQAFLPHMGPNWTAEVPLVGGDIAGSGEVAYDQWLRSQAGNYPWVPRALLSRLGRAYGSQLGEVLGDASSISDLGLCFGVDLYQREVEYLIAREWARSGEDILWRRSKLGLYFDPAQVECLEAFVRERLQGGVHT
ncbi:glycerol-3-phosphate dehydrogenase [Gammaproteobacteria bacterium 54_18_T64]|nr:glycerol-3-phosphate dehydrogenase [Gammaproteobacteria bacterium 54_18_T64]